MSLTIPVSANDHAQGPADAPVTLTLSGDLAGLAKNTSVLAVSLEPPGGSTTGLPTGPVIGTGKLTNL